MSDKNTPPEAEVVEQVAEEQTVESTEGAPVETAEERIAALEAELAAANAKVDDQKDSVLRAMAEADNARRRAAQETDKARKFALEKFAGDLLEVIDNLERALQAADRENEELKPLIEGIELTQKGFAGVVEKHGMQVIDPLGEPLDPNKHQAMGMQPSAEYAPNHVMMVMQKGYELNGRLLRPAMVMVAQAPQGVDTQV
ncbi:nucleotide exchange factor GrpE [Corallincola platygyrae]|uniref:Protein GrpE n=1 Tax=Corallincola platygyrae TaxID=1193278 RepID=A0ABW4XI17_9GAMM